MGMRELFDIPYRELTREQYDQILKYVNDIKQGILPMPNFTLTFKDVPAIIGAEVKTFTELPVGDLRALPFTIVEAGRQLLPTKFVKANALNFIAACYKHLLNDNAITKDPEAVEYLKQFERVAALMKEKMQSDAKNNPAARTIQEGIVRSAKPAEHTTRDWLVNKVVAMKEALGAGYQRKMPDQTSFADCENAMFEEVTDSVMGRMSELTSLEADFLQRLLMRKNKGILQRPDIRSQMLALAERSESDFDFVKAMMEIFDKQFGIEPVGKWTQEETEINLAERLLQDGIEHSDSLDDFEFNIPSKVRATIIKQLFEVYDDVKETIGELGDRLTNYISEDNYRKALDKICYQLSGSEFPDDATFDEMEVFIFGLILRKLHNKGNTSKLSTDESVKEKLLRIIESGAAFLTPAEIENLFGILHIKYLTGDPTNEPVGEKEKVVFKQILESKGREIVAAQDVYEEILYALLDSVGMAEKYNTESVTAKENLLVQYLLNALADNGELEPLHSNASDTLLKMLASMRDFDYSKTLLEILDKQFGLVPKGSSTQRGLEISCVESILNSVARDGGPIILHLSPEAQKEVLTGLLADAGAMREFIDEQCKQIYYKTPAEMLRGQAQPITKESCFNWLKEQGYKVQGNLNDSLLNELSIIKYLQNNYGLDINNLSDLMSKKKDNQPEVRDEEVVTGTLDDIIKKYCEEEQIPLDCTIEQLIYAINYYCDSIPPTAKSMLEDYIKANPGFDSDITIRDFLEDKTALESRRRIASNVVMDCVDLDKDTRLQVYQSINGKAVPNTELIVSEQQQGKSNANIACATIQGCSDLDDTMKKIVIDYLTELVNDSTYTADFKLITNALSRLRDNNKIDAMTCKLISDLMFDLRGNRTSLKLFRANIACDEIDRASNHGFNQGWLDAIKSKIMLDISGGADTAESMPFEQKVLIDILQGMQDTNNIDALTYGFITSLYGSIRKGTTPPMDMRQYRRRIAWEEIGDLDSKYCKSSFKKSMQACFTEEGITPVREANEVEDENVTTNFVDVAHDACDHIIRSVREIYNKDDSYEVRVPLAKLCFVVLRIYAWSPTKQQDLKDIIEYAEEAKKTTDATGIAILDEAIKKLSVAIQ